MRFLRPAAGLTGLVLIATLSAASPADAARLQTSGWWWRAQTGQGVALPAPPYVPPDGLAVGNAPDGPSAVSAIRFDLEPGEAPISLKLTVHERLAPGAVPLVACLATSSWFGAQAGNWGERPKAACPPGARAGIASDDGSSVAFDVSSLPASVTLDLVILPEPGSTSSFEISFQAPQASWLTTRPSLGTGFEPMPSGGADAPASSPASSFGGTDEPIGFGDPIPPASVGAPTPDAPEGAPSQGDQPRAVGGFRPLAAPGTSSEPSDPRPLALVILAAVTAAMVALRREPLPAPRLLGPMAGRETAAPPTVEEAGGLGRFRRDRSGTPQSLT